MATCSSPEGAATDQRPVANGMYGGTKTEMERLIQDASKMTDVQERLGVTVDASSMSFDNIVKAIHVVQGAYEISGYSMDELTEKIKNHALTEQEVARVAQDMGKTYDEVMQMMKDGSLEASDAIILTGTTSREAQTTIEGSLNSLKGAWENWLTAIANPDLTYEQFTEKTDQLLETLEISLDNIVPKVAEIIGNVVTVVAERGPEIAQKVYDSFMGSLPPEVREQFQGFLDKVDEIWTFLTEKFLPAVGDLAVHFVDICEKMGPIADAAGPAVEDAFNKVKTAIDLVSGALGLASGAMDGANQATQWLSGGLDNLNGWFQETKGGVGDFFDSLQESASQKVGEVVGWFQELPDRIIGGLGDTGRMLYNAGQDIINGLVDGLWNAPNDVADTLYSIASNGVEEFKRFFGIASPSKLMARLGGYTMEGFAKGIDDGSEDAVRSMRDAAGSVYGAAQGDVQLGVGAAGGGIATAAPSGPVINIEHMEVREEEDIAKVAARLWTYMNRREEATSWNKSYTTA